MATNPFGPLGLISYQPAVQPQAPPPHGRHRFLHALGKGIGIAGAVTAEVLMPGVGGVLVGRMVAGNVGADPTQYLRLQNQIRQQGQIDLQHQMELQNQLQSQYQTHMDNQVRMQGQMQEDVQSYLTLQEHMQSQARMFEAMSSVLKAKHDSAMECLRNISR